MTRFLRPTTLIPAIAGFLLGLVANILPDYLTAGGRSILIALFVLTLVFGLAAVWLQSRHRPVEAVFRPPVALRTPLDRLTYARRGIIVFVSLYKPMPGSAPAALSPAQWRQAAETGDYQALDLRHSNLATAVASIISHRHRLEHCWLITTTSAGKGEQVGSVSYARPLADYLRQVEGLTCRFYGDADEGYAIPLDDDTLVAVKTRDLINTIFQQAEASGLSDNEIVADFSGCPRSMALGMILACLDRNRDIQFVGTHYNDKAEPVGDLFPVLFAFETEVEAS